MTERPFEDRSEVVKELYSELNVIKPHSGTGSSACDELTLPQIFTLDVEEVVSLSLKSLSSWRQVVSSLVEM